VYLAEDTQLGRQVALKLLPANLTDNKERLSRFKQEARATSTLNHPNILTIHEISQEGSLHFIATEFINGVTLRQQMKNTRMKMAGVLDDGSSCRRSCSGTSSGHCPSRHQA
ncbi:MAG: protein kinase, partial [Pyrinomonadaceae bacterium]